MRTLKLKHKIAAAVAVRLEEQYNELMDEIHVGGHDEDDPLEMEAGEAGHDTESNKLASIRREEAEEVKRLIQTFRNYQFQKEKAEVELLSLVMTNRGNFFISKALKAIEVDGEKYFLMATDAPVYAKMEGKKKGDAFEFNNITFKINDII